MITHKVLKSGQARPYQDSVYNYEITSDEGEEKTKAYALGLKKVDPENKTTNLREHNGACSFPFGLNTFYSFREIGINLYRFTVTSPYCD